MGALRSWWSSRTCTRVKKWCMNARTRPLSSPGASVPWTSCSRCLPGISWRSTTNRSISSIPTVFTTRCISIWCILSTLVYFNCSKSCLLPSSKVLITVDAWSSSFLFIFDFFTPLGCWEEDPLIISSSSFEVWRKWKQTWKYLCQRINDMIIRRGGIINKRFKGFNHIPNMIKFSIRFELWIFI